MQCRAWITFTISDFLYTPSREGVHYNFTFWMSFNTEYQIFLIRTKFRSFSKLEIRKRFAQKNFTCAKIFFWKSNWGKVLNASIFCLLVKKFWTGAKINTREIGFFSARKLMRAKNSTNKLLTFPVWLPTWFGRVVVNMNTVVLIGIEVICFLETETNRRFKSQTKRRKNTRKKSGKKNIYLLVLAPFHVTFRFLCACNSLLICIMDKIKSVYNTKYDFLPYENKLLIVLLHCSSLTSWQQKKIYWKN